MTRHTLLRLAVGDSGNGRARRLLRIWPLWERLAQGIWTVVPVPGSPHALFGIHFKQHRGETVSLPDGATAVPGDWLGEIHFDNHAFLRVLTDCGRARTGSEKFAIFPAFGDDLRAVAAWRTAGMPRPIVALVGVTVLGRGAVRLGFTVRARRGWILPHLDKLFVDGLLIIYTPEGVSRITRGKTAGDASSEVWMSVGELSRRYGPHEG